MKGEWLNDKLYSIDEKVRVEKGPQLIELICNEENLKDSVTFARYKIGKIDALGRAIMPEKIKNKEAREIAEARPSGVIREGEKMTVLDWRAIHVPHIWKIYKLQDERFIMVDEIESKDDALKRAKKLFGEI